MGTKVIYPQKGDKLAILTIREHTCGFFQMRTECVEAQRKVDPDTGHTVCLACERITVDSGLRACDICDSEYINLNIYEDPDYETNCPKCKVIYDL